MHFAQRKAGRHRSANRVLLHPLDRETRSADRGQRIPIEIAAVHHPTPERVGEFLQQRTHPVRAAYVLEEANRSAGTQHTAQLGESRAGIGNRTEDQRLHRGIEAMIAKRQRLCVSLADRDPCPHGGGASGSERRKSSSGSIAVTVACAE